MRRNFPHVRRCIRTSLHPLIRRRLCENEVFYSDNRFPLRLDISCQARFNLPIDTGIFGEDEGARDHGSHERIFGAISRTSPVFHDCGA